MAPVRTVEEPTWGKNWLAGAVLGLAHLLLFTRTLTRTELVEDAVSFLANSSGHNSQLAIVLMLGFVDLSLRMDTAQELFDATSKQWECGRHA